MIFIIAASLATLMFLYLWVGVLLWIVCGCPPAQYDYVKRIWLCWPGIFFSKSYYTFYMKERDRELYVAWQQRDKEQHEAHLK